MSCIVSHHVSISSRRCGRIVAMLLVAAALLGAGWAEVARGAHHFEMIVNNQEAPFTLFTCRSAGAINDSGEVTFFASESTVGSGDIYKTSGGGVYTQISTDSSHFVVSAFTSSINEAGLVAFSGAPAFQSGLHLGNGGGLNTLRLENNFDPHQQRNPVAPTINNNGEAAFFGTRRNFPDQPAGTTVNGYYVASGGEFATLVEEGAVYDAVGFEAPAFNDAGQAAFTASHIGDGTTHLLRYDGPGLATIDTGYTASQQLSMNASGDVAFVNQDSSAVKVYGDSGVETIASTADGFNSFRQSAAFINDSSELAFEGQVIEFDGDPINWTGVFTGTDLVEDRVLIHGDPLFGRTVTDINLLGFNNVGQMLMYVELSGPSVVEGTYQTLVVATPILDGDFDENGFVDGDDLADWEAGFGETGTAEHADGDADGDLDVDGNDFLAWQRQVGMGVQPPELVAVPEPASGGLAATLGGLGVLAQKRRRR